MAELISAASTRYPLPPIPASTQLLAVAWLRWRIFVNGFFRRQPKGTSQAVGLVFAILLRILIWPIFAVMAIGPIVFSGYLGWDSIANHHPGNLVPLLTGILMLWQFLSINGLSIAATTSSFDPSLLARYPLRFGRYLVLRTFVGLLTPSTVVGFLASLAAAAGIGIADPLLALPALVVMVTYALMNLFLTRMVAAWFERWLANRRFREIFTVVMALGFASIQLLTPSHDVPHAHARQSSWMLNFAHSSAPFMGWLPPGLAAHSILFRAHPLASLAQFAALVAYTILFLATFAIRLHKQFLGEFFSEDAGRAAPAKAVHRRPIAAPASDPAPAAASMPPRTVFSPVISACLRKEFLVLRSNTTQLVNMVTPLIFVIILNRGVFARHPAYFLPGALGYVLLQFLAGLYNIFGGDGLGVQMYLLAPVRMSDVIAAKNIASLALIAVESALTWTLVLTLGHSLIPFSGQVSAALWLVFFVAANLALGTLLSIQAPRRFVPGQTRQLRVRTTASRTSGLLVLLVLAGSLLLQVPVILLSRYLHQPWLGAGVFALLAAVAVAAYALMLGAAEKLILSHRDLFAEELCKV